MDNLLSLRNILEQQVGAYCELLALSEQEKEAVINNDVQALTSIVEKQQSTLAVIQKLKGNEESLSLRAEAGMPEGGLRIDDLIQSAQGALHEELQALVEKLEDTGKKLRSISALNKSLIDTQLKYTSFCMNLLTGQDTPGTYSDSGRVDEGHKTNHYLVDQAI